MVLEIKGKVNQNKNRKHLQSLIKLSSSLKEGMKELDTIKRRIESDKIDQ